MKSGRLGPVVVAVLLVGSSRCCSVIGDVVTLQPVADTCLFSLEPDNNMGAEGRLILGAISDRHPGEKGRVLVRFDLSPVPASATITAAHFTLQVLKENFSAVDSRVGMHRMLKAWAEGQQMGSNGSPAEDGESTWSDRLKGSEAWGAGGGKAGTDFEADASSTVTFHNSESYTWPSTPALVADLQGWLTQPGSNFGWMLMSQDEESSFTSRRVASREVDELGPQLVVEYSTAPPPPKPDFNGVALKEGAIELRFHGEPGNLYTIFYADTPQVGPGNVLTNIPVKLIPADAVVSDPTDQPRRFYRLAITAQID
jgi:hypothetical protein